jgi:peptide/nickel transport system ATP-binding protein
VLLDGTDLMKLSEPALREVRWKRISMVFQSAMDALNPVITIAEQLTDTLRAHTSMSGRQARDRAADLLGMVGIPRSQLDSYAHQLSGGMRQRVCIAIALALEPSLVILDEPTTALDVIVEREILLQLRELQSRLGFSVLFITHDLGRMLQFSDRVAIFYAARLVETGPSRTLATAPRHPYTRGLLRAFPSLHGESVDREGIPGAPPSLKSPPPGCRFHPRCPLAMDVCRGERPPLVEITPGHSLACYAEK